jgi:deoxyribodipyrimidine photo-lyase
MLAVAPTGHRALRRLGQASSRSGRLGRMQHSLDGALVWLRRDLRWRDNAALYHALKAARQVWCAFVFDRDILDPLPRRDRRVEFIHDSVVDLDRELHELAERHGASNVRLLVRHGYAKTEVVSLAKQLSVQAVYASHDDEPFALQRDADVRTALATVGIALHTVKDHVIFERSEVLTATAKPYTVFTPYKNAWLKKIEPFFVKSYPVDAYASGLAAPPRSVEHSMPSLESIGFERTNLRELKVQPGSSGARDLLADFLHRIDRYGQARDFPAVRGPSYLSVHLRFGTASIRELAAAACERMEKHDSPGAAVWLSELIWRDFYHQILHHHPHVVGASFRPEYDKIRWERGDHADEIFQAWCDGRTGYPLIDAAMAQINQTGYMHNRLRMVTASFLSKDLGIDWKRGEEYFAVHLIDFDLAANNGGWQWAASTGCDAQPWFRIFNPVTQSRKFDPQGAFIRRYLPQLARLSDDSIHEPWTASADELAKAGVSLGHDYPRPIVDHETARKQTLERFSVVKSSG